MKPAEKVGGCWAKSPPSMYPSTIHLHLSHASYSLIHTIMCIPLTLVALHSHPYARFPIHHLVLTLPCITFSTVPCLLWTPLRVKHTPQPAPLAHPSQLIICLLYTLLTHTMPLVHPLVHLSHMPLMHHHAPFLTPLQILFEPALQPCTPPYSLPHPRVATYLPTSLGFAISHQFSHWLWLWQAGKKMPHLTTIGSN